MCAITISLPFGQSAEGLELEQSLRRLQEQLHATGTIESLHRLQQQLDDAGVVESLRRLQEQLDASGLHAAMERLQDHLDTSGLVQLQHSLQEQFDKFREMNLAHRLELPSCDVEMAAPVGYDVPLSDVEPLDDRLRRIVREEIDRAIAAASEQPPLTEEDRLYGADGVRRAPGFRTRDDEED